MGTQGSVNTTITILFSYWKEIRKTYDTSYKYALMS